MKRVFNKIFCLTIFLIISSTSAYSQIGWYQLNGGTKQNLNFIEENYLVGDSGILMRTTNAGVNWLRIPTGTTQNFNSLSNGYIVGDSGLILKSTNGSIWIRHPSGTTLKLNSVNYFYAFRLAVGDSGIILRNSSGSNKWDKVPSGTTNNLNFVKILYGHAYIVGDGGIFLRSTNNGYNWQSINTGTNENLNKLSYNNLIAGDHGTILLSQDYTNSWSILNTGTTTNLNSITQIGNLIWAAGANGLILKSTNYGYTWTKDIISTTEEINSIHFFDYNTGWIVGNHGLIAWNNTATYLIELKKFDANQISTWFKNDGSFNNTNSSNGDGGFEWPIGSGKKSRYAACLRLGCIIGNDTLTSGGYYSETDYKNGYIDNFGNPQGYTDSNYRIYKIVKGDTLSTDYLNWPVYQGAYVNSYGRPYFLGTQTMFYVYNDTYLRLSGLTSINPLKAQILQTNWAYNGPGYLTNVIFTEYRIINRSTNIWNNFYLGIFNDDDASSTSGKTACDTVRNLGYSFNANNNHPQYGSSPPAIGDLFLRGLHKFTGNSNDTVRYYNPPGSSNLIVKVGYKELKLRICNPHQNSGGPTPAPITNGQTYRVLTGYKSDGSQWINPNTNSPTAFVYSGDPVSGTGWNMMGGAYRRTVRSSGPINVNPGDTVSILYAQLIAQGTSNLNSVVKLRETADYVQQIYDENFQSVVSVNNISSEIPQSYELFQNYPNPFNPTTNIVYNLPTNNFVTIKVYDVLGKELMTLVNEFKSAGSHTISFNGSNLPSGAYYYRIKTTSSLTGSGKNFEQVRKMVLLK